MILCSASGSTSVEFAVRRPHTLRAYSVTAHWKP